MAPQLHMPLQTLRAPPQPHTHTQQVVRQHNHIQVGYAMTITHASWVRHLNYRPQHTHTPGGLDGSITHCLGTSPKRTHTHTHTHLVCQHNHTQLLGTPPQPPNGEYAISTTHIWRALHHNNHLNNATSTPHTWWLATTDTHLCHHNHTPGRYATQLVDMLPQPHTPSGYTTTTRHGFVTSLQLHVNI